MLTENEMSALKMCVTCNNRAAQHQDNSSEVGLYDFAGMLFNHDVQAAESLVTELTNKGMGYTVGKWPASFQLTELGINTVFNLLDQDPKSFTITVEV